MVRYKRNIELLYHWSYCSSSGYSWRSSFGSDTFIGFQYQKNVER